MRYNTVYILLVLILLSACMRLDEQLFNNESLSEYKFDQYTGEKELPDLPSLYTVADSMKQLFSLTSSGEEDAKIYAVYVGDLKTINTDTVILYCHGNAHHMDWYWNRTKLLAHTGAKHQYGVVTFDYRGYGMSEGKPSEKGMYADVEAVLKWLISKGVTNERLVVYGYSLGSAPACEISSENYSLKPSKLILEAPFASSQVMVNDASKLSLPASYFTNNKINNAEKIKQVNQPFLWMHGTQDDFLNITTHGEIVYKNYGGSYKEAIRVSGAVHNNLPAVLGYERYVNTISGFVIHH